MFVLVANRLDRLISKAKESGLIGSLPASLKTSIANLQYTDDTLLFSQSDMKYAIALKWILRCFEAWFGLKINFPKAQ